MKKFKEKNEYKKKVDDFLFQGLTTQAQPGYLLEIIDLSGYQSKQHEWLHVWVGLYKAYVDGSGQPQHTQQGEVWMEFSFRRKCTYGDSDAKCEADGYEYERDWETKDSSEWSGRLQQTDDNHPQCGSAIHATLTEGKADQAGVWAPRPRYSFWSAAVTKPTDYEEHILKTCKMSLSAVKWKKY